MQHKSCGYTQEFANVKQEVRKTEQKIVLVPKNLQKDKQEVQKTELKAVLIHRLPADNTS